jgi:hypothetical protein
MGSSVAAQHLQDLSDRIARRGTATIPQIVGLWYRDIRETKSKREADGAYRLYSMVCQVYSAGKTDGGGLGQFVLKHVEKVEIKNPEANMAEKIVNIDARGAIGSVFNIGEYLVGVSNTINQTVTQSKAADNVKDLLKELSDRIAAAAPNIKDEAGAKEIGVDATTLSGEVAGAKRQKWYELSLSGLKDAAVAVGEVGKPILETVLKLAPLLGVVFH